MRTTEPMTIQPLAWMKSSISRSPHRGRHARTRASGGLSAKRPPGRRLPGVDLLQLGERDLLDRIRLVHEDGEAVERDGELDHVLPVLGLDLLLLLRLHGARRLADVGLAVDQRLD